MIQISKDQRKSLEKFGLLHNRKVGIDAQDQNFVVVNKEHMSRDKKTYVVEEPEIMAFLQLYEGMNLQKIYPNQLKTLKDKGFVTDDQIQNPNEYKPNALVYIDDYGQARCKKIAKLMIGLGIWKDNKH